MSVEIALHLKLEFSRFLVQLPSHSLSRTTFIMSGMEFSGQQRLHDSRLVAAVEQTACLTHCQ